LDITLGALKMRDHEGLQGALDSSSAFADTATCDADILTDTLDGVATRKGSDGKEG
jgi:hypothetical protein